MYMYKINKLCLYISPPNETAVLQEMFLLNTGMPLATPTLYSIRFFFVLTAGLNQLEKMENYYFRRSKSIIHYRRQAILSALIPNTYCIIPIVHWLYNSKYPLCWFQIPIGCSWQGQEVLLTSYVHVGWHY
jgi:hypothetical protein